MMRSLLRSMAWWVIDRWSDPAVDRAWAWSVIDRYPDNAEDRLHAWRILRDRLPIEDEIATALRRAFLQAGVALEQFAPDAALGGKRYEVLHHAAIALGNPLRTVADIKELLQ